MTAMVEKVAAAICEEAGPDMKRDASAALEATLRERLGLTHAEARVAALLAEGLSYADAAERLGVSYHTIHSHVKAVHRKAKVSTNGRLLALLRELMP